MLRSLSDRIFILCCLFKTIFMVIYHFLGADILAFYSDYIGYKHEEVHVSRNFGNAFHIVLKSI